MVALLLWWRCCVVVTPSDAWQVLLAAGVKRHGEEFATIAATVLPHHKPADLAYCWRHKLRPGAAAASLQLPAAPAVFGAPAPPPSTLGTSAPAYEPSGEPTAARAEPRRRGAQSPAGGATHRTRAAPVLAPRPVVVDIDEGPHEEDELPSTDEDD